MWHSKMFDGIKAGQTRMEIASALDIPVSAISRAALMMISNHDYRKAGITDEQFAKWFVASLVGFKTFDGDVAIEWTEPQPEKINSVLANIKKFDAPVELPKLKQFKPYPVDCINCRMNGMFGRCPKHAYADNKAIGCKNFKSR